MLFLFDYITKSFKQKWDRQQRNKIVINLCYVKIF